MKISALLLLVLPAALDPVVSSAQSAAYRDSYVISAGELGMSGKAINAFKQGTKLLQKGQIQASIPYFEKAISLAPASFRSYHNLALAHYRLGQFQAAQQDFQKSIDRSQGRFAPSLFGLSMALYQRSDFPLAESVVQRGLLVAPDSGVGHYCLALIQFSMGRLGDSEKAALAALRLDPAEIDAHLLLAHIHETLRNPDATIADVRSYLRLTPNHDLDTDALRILARAQHDLAASPASAN